jgi:deaminated glutathione amidase
MKPYLAAAVQMTSLPNLEKNLVQAEELIAFAVNQGAELVCLPENFSFLGDEAAKADQAQAIAAESQKFLVNMSQRYQVTLLGGGFPEPATPAPALSQGKLYNTALLVSPAGEELARYHKMHLFDVNLPDGNTYRESEIIVAGIEPPPIYRSDHLGNLGLSVCYDVRFPELYRYLAVNGANVLIIPAAFTAFTGKDHWQVLLQARAIENTCYVIAPAQVGKHNPRRQSHGHAMIIDPWGTILADANDQVGLAIAEINPNRLEQVRRQMPSLQHRVFKF